jgi:hypothetical protein
VRHWKTQRRWKQTQTQQKNSGDEVEEQPNRLNEQMMDERQLDVPMRVVETLLLLSGYRRRRAASQTRRYEFGDTRNRTAAIDGDDLRSHFLAGPLIWKKGADRAQSE